MPFVLVVVAAPLAVVLGVLSGFLKGLILPSRPGESVWASARYRSLGYLLVFLASMGLGATQVVPEWGMQTDEERDFILSAVCAEGGGCPLVGNEMNQLRIKLGPLNRYLMTLCHLVTADPRFTLWVILTLHALGAAWLAAAGDRFLAFPYGLIAGLSFGTNPLLLEVISNPSNGSWASFFQVGVIAGALQWMRGEQLGVIVAITCLAAACQLHGTNLVLVPPLLFAALYWRPPLSRRSALFCALVLGSMYSPWLVYQWQTGLADFSLASGSWIVGQGPSPTERLLRAVEPLRGMLTPFAVLGAAALALGRGVAPSERKGGRLTVLFLAVPLAATLLAGANWSSRYGAPMVAPGAIASAAGLRMLASMLPGSRRWELCYGLGIASLFLILVAGEALSGKALRGRAATVSRSRMQLTLAEQIEAIRILGKHGFGAQDLESRVHGSAWNRWEGGHVYLGKWLIGSASRAAAGEHAVIVDCNRAAAGFASWREDLTSASPAPRLLVGYDTQLTPIRTEFSAQEGVLWTSRHGVPFYREMLHGGDAQLRAAWDPRLAYPPGFEHLLARWPRHEAFEMRLSTTLIPGFEDRLLALIHDAELNATVSFDGMSRDGIEPAVSLGNSILRRYLVAAAERAAGIVIEVSIRFPAGATVPERVDLFEEPPCAGE